MNETTAVYDFAPVTKMFERHAMELPNKPAVVSTAKCMTYGELNRAANGVADTLLSVGLGAEDIVLILLERGIDTYAANLGVLKAGCAYVIVSMKYPDERIRFIFEDSGAKAIITGKEVLSQRGELIKDLQTKALCIEDMMAAGKDDNPNVDINPGQLCYCIYTSGSTGRPKGVMIEHGNLTNFVWPSEKNREAMGIIDRASVLLAIAQMTFDVSVMEEFLGLTAGLTVAMASEEEILNAALMKQFILRTGVDGMCATPAYINTLISMQDMREVFAHITTYDLGAEAFPPALYTKITAINPNAYIMNGYGPTEATISCTMQVVESAEHVTIGVPNANVYAYIINDSNEELPQGEIGELLICGLGVGRGYINLPEKTAEVFITFRGMRGFKTGDLACITPEGEIAYHGRKDNQVKLRGLRIELGEIESVMQSVSGVKQAVVRVKKILGADHLVAYYVTEGADIDEQFLREILAGRLAEYMVPDYYMELDHFEMTANQKINDKVLPDIKPKLREAAPPRTALEKTVLELCAAQIDFEGFGVTDPLSQLGFTSLSLMVIAADIYSEYQVDLPLTQLLAQDCTVERICRLIEDGQSTGGEAAESANEWPVTPQQLPLMLSSSGHQVDRRIVFGGMKAERLRDALLRVVNGAPIFSVNFFEKDGGIWQKASAHPLVAQEVPILSGEGDEEAKKAFFTAVDILAEKLYAFAIYERENEAELWMRVHHALIDHVGMKLFCDRLVKAYDEPQADMTETVDYYDYAQMLARQARPVYQANKMTKPLAESRGFTRRMVTMPENKAGRTESDLLLNAAAKAAACAMDMKDLTVQFTFGGRKQAKYFDTIGYFPYAVPLTVTADDAQFSYTVGAKALDAIEACSPYDDLLVRRLENGDRSLFVLYNYMESFGREAAGRYVVQDEHIVCTEDERLPQITPHLEFNCVSNGKLGVFMLDYDTQLLTAEQAEQLLENAAAIFEKEASQGR